MSNEMSIICEDIPDSEETRKAQFGVSESLVRVRYNGENKIPGIDATKLTPCIFPRCYKKVAAEIEALKVYEDDVWITSFPRSGTTWTQEMVWLIVNDLDYEGAKKSSIMYRYGTLEFSGVLGDLNMYNGLNSVEYIEAMSRPRFIKTHLPISLLPTDIWTVKPKMVHITRNPKDMAISYYHFASGVFGYKESLETFLDSFLNDLVWWAPYKDHFLDYQKLRNEPNILFITYEDMSNDLDSVLRQVATFFNKTYTSDKFEQLAKHLSFNKMKSNKGCNYEAAVVDLDKELNQNGMNINSNFQFYRRGQVKSAEDEMPAEYQAKFDNWIAESFKESDFKINS